MSIARCCFNEFVLVTKASDAVRHTSSIYKPPTTAHDIYQCHLGFWPHDILKNLLINYKGSQASLADFKLNSHPRIIFT
jgi:hypothetical protein